MKNQKNELIQDYLKVDKIKHPPTKSDLLHHLAKVKQHLFQSLTLDQQRDLGERIAQFHPMYGKLYE